MIGLGPKYQHEVVVNTKDGQVFKGIYWGAPGKVVRLRQVEMLETKRPIEVDGEVVIFKTNISFIQRIL